MSNIKKMKKTLNKGMHILSIPSGDKLFLNNLFPKEISGSTIEKLNAKGKWHQKEVILYENNTFNVSDNYKFIYPLQAIRLVLKRNIDIEWDVGLVSYSGLENTKLIPKNGFDINEALYLAQLSELIYSQEGTIKKTIEESYDFDTFHYYSRHNHGKLLKQSWLKNLIIFFKSKTSIVDLQFMHLSRIDEKTGKNLIVIVFKGSQEPQDWITNFDFRYVDFNNNRYIHKGFKQAAELFFKIIRKKDLTNVDLPITLLRNIKNINENTQIFLTGHSLGGALATVVGCYLHELGVKKENFEIYTFGSPPVGTKDFTDYYNNKINLFRLVNEYDVVPKLDKVLKLFHLGTKIVLPSNDGETHACKGYIDNILDKSKFQQKIK